MLKRLMTFFRLLRTGWVLIRHDALVPTEYAEMVPWPVRFIGAISRIFSLGNRKGNAASALPAPCKTSAPPILSSAKCSPRAAICLTQNLRVASRS